MAPTAGSSAQSMRSLMPAPATRSSAAAISLGVVVSAGQVHRGPAAPGGVVDRRRPQDALQACGAVTTARSGCPGGTGHAGALAGQRFADDAGQEARRRGVRRSGPHRHRHQPHGPAAHEALARVVGHQLLADELLDAVARLRPRAGCRRPRRRPGPIAGSLPNTASELEKTTSGGSACRRRVLQHGARAVDVGAHAEVEVGLGRAADHTGEVEDGVDRAESGSAAVRSPTTARTRASSVRSAGGATRSTRISSPRSSAVAPPSATGASSSRRASNAPRKPAPPVMTMRVLMPSPVVR